MFFDWCVQREIGRPKNGQSKIGQQLAQTLCADQTGEARSRHTHWAAHNCESLLCNGDAFPHTVTRPLAPVPYSSAVSLGTTDYSQVGTLYPPHRSVNSGTGMTWCEIISHNVLIVLIKWCQNVQSPAKSSTYCLPSLLNILS